MLAVADGQNQSLNPASCMCVQGINTILSIALEQASGPLRVASAGIGLLGASMKWNGVGDCSISVWDMVLYGITGMDH